jgi:hypothetical protein
MLSAKQVQEKQSNHQNSVVERELKLIEEAIENAINNNNNCAFYYSDLNPLTISRLRDLDYKVSVESYQFETTVTISWW